MRRKTILNEETRAGISSVYALYCYHSNAYSSFAYLGGFSMNDSIEENDRQAAETNRIGAEGNRISAETDRVSADTARNDASDKRDSNRAKKDIGQLLAYVLIVIVATGGFYQMNKVNERVCVSAQENRAAIRGLVVALDVLGKSLISEDKKSDNLSPEEVEGMKLFDDFTKKQLKGLEEPVC